MTKEPLKNPSKGITIPNPLSWLSGIKTYIAGIGLVGLGIHQLSQGDIQVGIESIAAGLAIIGIGHKIEKSTK